MGGCASCGSQAKGGDFVENIRRESRSNDRQRDLFHTALNLVEPFEEMSEGLCDELFYKSVLCHYKSGQMVYKKKAVPDGLYFVVLGSIVSDGGGDNVFKEGQVFGQSELLMPGMTRQFGMRASRGGATTRKVSMEDIYAALEKKDALLQTDAFRVLQQTPVFSGLGDRELLHLKELLFVRRFSPSETIITRGSTKSDEMFIIESGGVVVTDYADDKDQSLFLKAASGILPAFTVLPKEIRMESQGYFGEEALLVDTDNLEVGERPRRKATVTASPEIGCVCLVLTRDVFDRVLSKVKHRFYRNIIARDAEFIQMIESGDKKPEEAERETWENHRSGKFGASKLKGKGKKTKNRTELEVEEIREVAKRVSQRLSTAQPKAGDRSSGRKKADHGYHKSHRGDEGEGEGENWGLSSVFCGAI